MASFAVFGNPIKHSKSPDIYSIFAEEMGISSSYDRILASFSNFEMMLGIFFKNGGIGANITAPFKEYAYSLCKHRTERAIIAGSVNVLKKNTDGFLSGDNTDGVGLLVHLQYLNWLHSRTKSKILLIGAGGAARGIIFPLLNFGHQILLTNRTFLRAQRLVNHFFNKGDISVISLDQLSTLEKVDLIINATTTGMYGDVPDLPSSLINPFVNCYDLFYKEDIDTPFIMWCKKYGAKFCSDGLGMLVGQAAYSFLFWHNTLPSISSALSRIRLK
ncbi:shikimate dehydrogenase [Blochmannia endosymbiont of Colobopsis nipponica]|uniref:shikimate dehydrogenase n=1 Tax=Blochmannia endosymbiont of Colobopsis nipponica TaxID=2681987 RepID=UPI001780091A|nr:shikimate dehydrogenase [Blochmannia endosymbiont of Colobopsis nipponica]QOI11198.1 shikimate dehydrogenase [Blochmannia endosymbiont of Colobopsis nipponica]